MRTGHMLQNRDMCMRRTCARNYGSLVIIHGEDAMQCV